MTRPAELIEVGVIIDAHGIRGQVKLRSHTTPAEAIYSHKPLVDSKGRELKLKAGGGTARGLIASVEGVTDRNAAELLKNTRLYAPADFAAGHGMKAQTLVGLEAKLADGTLYGTVIAAHNFGAGDIVEIKKQNGDTEMLPFDGTFAKEHKGALIVSPPEYLEGGKE